MKPPKYKPYNKPRPSQPEPAPYAEEQRGQARRIPIPDHLHICVELGTLRVEHHHIGKPNDPILDQRLERIEKVMAGLIEDIEQIAANVGEIGTGVDEIKVGVGNIGNDVGRLRKQIDDLITGGGMSPEVLAKVTALRETTAGLATTTKEVAAAVKVVDDLVPAPEQPA